MIYAILYIHMADNTNYLPDDIIYYSPHMVINITEYDYRRNPDMNIFITYDTDEDLIYVFGSRGYEARGNIEYAKYVKTFSNYNDLYNFIALTMGFIDGHRISISVNILEGLTNYCEYDELKNKVSRANEIVAYDNIQLPKRLLFKYISAFLC